ncbi:hypothetical protein EDB19DRAFT_705980 [Suillus lakei]|nr:hypothetical protein EDB19DRAFT_705980 [Suillus lakei]
MLHCTQMMRSKDFRLCDPCTRVIIYFVTFACACLEVHRTILNSSHGVDLGLLSLVHEYAVFVPRIIFMAITTRLVFLRQLHPRTVNAQAALGAASVPRDKVDSRMSRLASELRHVDLDAV